MRVGTELAPAVVPSLSLDTDKNSPESAAVPLEDLAPPSNVAVPAHATTAAEPSHPMAEPAAANGRPRRQCRQNISYTDNDLDAILEQHILENHRARKRKDHNENEPIKKRGRAPKATNGAPAKQKSKADDACSSGPVKQPSLTGPSTSSATNSSHFINEQQRKVLMASLNKVEYELKFMDVDRLHFEMQTRDEAHLNPDFRRTLVDDWVSTSYDHDFHLGRLMELAKKQDQQYADSIMHTVFVMRGLLNVKNENNLLKLKVEELMRTKHKSGSSSGSGSSGSV